jgi:hypothetical protein
MGDYLRRGWDVITRHKKKVVALGLVGASVGGYYYVKHFLNSSLEQFALASKQMGQRLSAMNYKTNEAKRIREEGASIIGTFVPPLRRRLYSLTGTLAFRFFSCRPVSCSAPSPLGPNLNLFGYNEVASILFICWHCCSQHDSTFVCNCVVRGGGFY